MDTYKVPVETYGGHTQAKSINARGLIVHDMHDHDVSVEEARMLHDAWKGSRLLITKNNGHRRILMGKNVIASIADFFGKRPANRSTNPSRSKSQTPSEPKPNQDTKVAKADVNQNTDEVVKRKPRPKRRPAKKPISTETTSVKNEKVETTEQPKNEKPRAPRKPQRRRPPRNNQKSENAAAKPSNDAASPDNG